MYYTISFIFV